MKCNNSFLLSMCYLISNNCDCNNSLVLIVCVISFPIIVTIGPNARLRTTSAVLHNFTT